VHAFLAIFFASDSAATALPNFTHLQASFTIFFTV
jgi:hypothetical protein